MPRAVLDANVLISALVRPSGPPGQILHALLSRQAFELVLSSEIVAEVERGLELPRIRKYLTDPRDARLVVADIVALADLVEETATVSGVCRDPEDDRVLGAALEGRAAMIVTGDRDLLALKEHEGVRIMTPREFLDRLRAG